jgi:hypothetical protein
VRYDDRHRLRHYSSAATIPAPNDSRVNRHGISGANRMITLMNTALNVYACPACDAGKGTLCSDGDPIMCLERLNVASKDLDVLRACVYTMWDGPKGVERK